MKRARKDIHNDVKMRVEEEYQRLAADFLKLKKEGAIPKSFRLKFADIQMIMDSLGLEKIRDFTAMQLFKKLETLQSAHR